MLTIDYLITAHGVIERGLFYNYMHNLGYKDDSRLGREYMINSKYPYGICIKKKVLLVVESATNCYLMHKSGKIKSIDEIKELFESDNNDIYYR